MSDLEDGSKYQFRVYAENAAGAGQPCEPITLIAKDPYGGFLKFVYLQFDCVL